jgi:hypothetical protein
MALNDAGASYRYNGASWAASAPVSTGGPLSPGASAYVSCASTTFCMAVPGGNVAVMWNGSSWIDPTTLPGAQGLQALACAGEFCTTVDGIGDAYFYTGTWSSAVNAWGGPSDISCVSPTFCIATAGGIAQWNGSDWTQPQDVDTSGQLEAVSCVSTTFCVATDSVGDILAWNGSSWSVPQAVDPGTGAGALGSNELVSVSCVGPSFCVAVDSGGRAVTFDGKTWSTPRLIDTRSGLRAVSCATASDCVALDGDGDVLTYR